MLLLFSKLKVLPCIRKNMPSLSKFRLKYFQVVLSGQSTTSTKPVRVYMSVGFSLVRFDYPTIQKKHTEIVMV